MGKWRARGQVSRECRACSRPGSSLLRSKRCFASHPLPGTRSTLPPSRGRGSFPLSTIIFDPMVTGPSDESLFRGICFEKDATVHSPHSNSILVLLEISTVTSAFFVVPPAVAVIPEDYGRAFHLSGKRNLCLERAVPCRRSYREPAVSRIFNRDNCTGFRHRRAVTHFLPYGHGKGCGLIRRYRHVVGTESGGYR